MTNYRRRTNSHSGENTLGHESKLQTLAQRKVGEYPIRSADELCFGLFVIT